MATYRYSVHRWCDHNNRLPFFQGYLSTIDFYQIKLGKAGMATPVKPNIIFLPE